MLVLILARNRRLFNCFDTETHAKKPTCGMEVYCFSLVFSGLEKSERQVSMVLIAYIKIIHVVHSWHILNIHEACV